MDRAEVIYNAIKRRMKSRFEKFGRLPGMLFIVSSKSTQDDFTARRVRESRRDPTIFVRDYALWDVKPEEYYSVKKFQVLGGNEQTPSRILAEGEAASLRDTLPEGCVIVDVPEDWKADFERDLEGALRDIAGVATIAISPFIQRRDKILEGVDRDRQHPFSVQVYDASRGGMFLWDRMVRLTKTRQYGQRVEKMLPILNPNAPRHVHIDPALRNDALGFCMSHIHGWKDVVRRDPNDLKRQFVERAPIYIVDFMLRVVPPTGDEIILGDVRRMVYDLSAHGYLITTVSMDSFQSADSLQQLSAKGYSAELVSVDTTPEPYDNFKLALYENRLFFYDYPPFVEEVRTLEQHIDRRKKRKIDHPPRGSKDIADAVAGCLWTLSIKAPNATPLSPLRGFSKSAAEDAWLEEQRQALAAGQRGADLNQDLRDYGMLPPFLTGSGGSEDPDQGSGWGGGGWGLGGGSL
jgi:hypothetical protein